MTHEEKQLLLKDLSARLPYYTFVKCTIVDEDSDDILRTYMVNDLMFRNPTLTIKPYLRPMSSMTEEEETLFRCELPAIAKTDAQLVAMRMELFLKGHLDFNHLIDKGLALEAPEGMYKTE